MTINKFLEEVNYPLPRIEDLFQALQGGQKFSKIDLSQAYNQLVVDKKTSRILTWSTHRGLYEVKRLPFGCKPNSSVFQAKIDSVLLGCEGTIAFIDDIVVTGKDDKEHLKNLTEVFDRLSRAGLKAKTSKCEFFQSKVTYLGFVIDALGLHKCDEKVRAISCMPNPTNKTQIRAFCGLINYYSRFMQNLSSDLKPLYSLLHDDTKFVWNTQCEKAMEKVKKRIMSDIILVHYNPDLPILLTTDASNDGIGACLAHKLQSGDEKPIAFASRTFGKSEANYAMVDKEALAIYFGVKKFQQYLIGRKFCIKTDHKPLVAIFGEKRGIPVMAAGRLQRWATFLSSFDFTILYVRGKDNGCADALSRLSLPEGGEVKEGFSYLNTIGRDFQKPIRFEDVARETDRDPSLVSLVNLLRNGWPDSCAKSGVDAGYFVRRHELTLEQGVIMWGHRAIIPQKFRQVLLKEVHSAHIGIVRAKALVRSYFWWPKIDGDVENLIKSCVVCRTNQNNPPRVESVPWPKAGHPMQRVHLDYCGPIEGNNFLILIDSYSKWLEVCRTKLITTERTVQLLRPIFARLGVPLTIVSDNATSFTSFEFQKFCEVNGIVHVTSPAYHPESNGQAENSVKTFKMGLKKMLDDPLNRGRNVDKLIEQFLYINRNTQHMVSGETPSKLMFGRDSKLRWDKIIPTKNTKRNIPIKDVNVKHLKVDDRVFVKNFKNDK